MKTLKIDNTSFFSSKEHYFSVKQAWKAYIKQGKAKKVQNDPDSRPVSPLTALHHLLYNALLGNDIALCTTPITNKTKLANGCTPYDSYHRNYSRLAYYASNPSAWRRQQFIESLLEPFDGTVTEEMLVLAVQQLKSVKEWRDSDG